MERHYTKAQILEAYLNHIPFGHGWFGVDAAARHYFGKPAGRLTLAEAATLAALPRSAPYYDPIRHPDRARTAARSGAAPRWRDQARSRRTQANAARREPLVDGARRRRDPAPYFVDASRAAALQPAFRSTRAAIACTGRSIRRCSAAADAALAEVRAAVESSAPDIAIRRMASTRQGRGRTTSQGLRRRDRPRDRRRAGAGRRSQLSGFAIRSCASRDPAARVRVQAVRLCSGAR